MESRRTGRPGGVRRVLLGMTLIETMVAVIILTVSVYLLSSTVTAAIAHSAFKRERTMAVEAAMNLFEVMRSEPFEELFARYNDDPSDDPAGVGTAPGKHFAAPGLDPWDDDADGFTGEITLPATGTVLREDTVDPTLSMPRDLNADVMIDDQDHALDYTLLPVRVEVAWQGKSGKRSFSMSTMFAKLEKLEQ